MSDYEKKYYDALLGGFREWGEDYEWSRLDDLRLKCGVPRKRAEELVAQILENEKLEGTQCEAIKSDIVITSDNFIEKHREKRAERDNFISEYKKCQAAIKKLEFTKSEPGKAELNKTKSYSERLSNAISESLYSELNDGCNLPFARNSINPDNWKELDDMINGLYALKRACNYSKDYDHRRKALLSFYDEKLRLFYELSIKSETSAAVYDTYQVRLHRALLSDDVNLLRKEDNESLILSTRKYAFSAAFEECRNILTQLNVSKPLRVYDDLRKINTTNSLGFTDIGALTRKTDGLQSVYEALNDSNCKLASVGARLNEYLLEMRTIAYKNIYLGVELLNFISENAFGKNLSLKKDGIAMQHCLDISAAVTKDLDVFSKAFDAVDSVSKMTNTLLDSKSYKNWASSNPKMAVGIQAASLVAQVAILVLASRTEKINKHNALQKQYVSGIGMLTGSFNDGKVQSYQAIKIIEKLSALNIGFLAVYAPLRDRAFVKGDVDFSMKDMKDLANAIGNYKHANDESL